MESEIFERIRSLPVCDKFWSNYSTSLSDCRLNIGTDISPALNCYLLVISIHELPLNFVSFLLILATGLQSHLYPRASWGRKFLVYQNGSSLSSTLRTCSCKLRFEILSIVLWTFPLSVFIMSNIQKLL